MPYLNQNQLNIEEPFWLPNRVIRKDKNMGLGPRKKNNDVRSRQGKMVNPKGSSPQRKQTETNAADSAGGGVPDKQYNQRGPKDTGPNYAQPVTGVSMGSGK